MSNEVAYLIERVWNAGALQDERDRAMADLAIRSVFPM
jgi:hypothetical protein